MAAGRCRLSARAQLYPMRGGGGGRGGEERGGEGRNGEGRGGKGWGREGREQEALCIIIGTLLLPYDICDYDNTDNHGTYSYPRTSIR